MSARRPRSRRRPIDARAAARGEGDRRLLRLGRRRQDVGRRRGRARRDRAPRRQGARAHDRSRPPARDRARPRRPRQPRAPGRARGAEGRGHRGARRAVGRDARHQAVVGRPRAAPRARRGDRVPHPREPAVHEPHRPLRAESRLHRDGAAVRDPRERRVRPHRHRHPADPQRDRLPRRAGAHGRLLRQPAAALADAAVPRRRQAGDARAQRREPALLPDGRPHPREPVPRRTSPSSS